MILMNDFKAEPPELRDAMLNAAQRVLESGWYVLGNEVKRFEQLWAETCGVAHGVGVGNGMDAIEIALRGLDIGPGDEVITTPMTAFATVLAIMRAGATPVLADIEPETALLSIDSARRCLTAKTRAVVLVHLYGQVSQMDNWVRFCEQQEILLIEDCAQAHLARSGEQIAGSFGRAGAYSFYPTKNLGAPGDAGMLVTDDSGLAERASMLRNYGQSVRYEHPEIGLNSRLDEIQAAMLLVRISHLQANTQRRQNIAEIYRSEVSNPHVDLMLKPEVESAHVYHLFVVTCSNRDALQAHLGDRAVQSLIHYPLPIHWQSSCTNIGRDPQGLPASEKHASDCLSIPCHPQMSNTDIETVVTAINTFRG